MIQIAICDDSREDRNAIKCILENYFNTRNKKIKLTEYEDGVVLLDDYADKSVHYYDLIFLDIFMKKSQGIDVAKQLRAYDKKVSIVLTTATDEFAMSGYAVHAYGYLVKPIQKAETDGLLDDFVRYFHCDRKQTLLIKNRNVHERIAYGEIIYMESMNPYVYIYLKDKSVHRIHAKLGDVEKEVAGKSFIRCHQSFIINMSDVQKVDKVFHMSDGTEIPIRRSELKELKEKYYQYVIQTGL